MSGLRLRPCNSTQNRFRQSLDPAVRSPHAFWHDRLTAELLPGRRRTGFFRGLGRRQRIREKAPEAVRPFFDLAKTAIKPYADAGKLQVHKDGIMFAAGITAVAAPGHTVGHTMVRVTSAGDELLIWGDIVHNAALQFPEPDRSIAFDHNPTMAIANRKKVFDMVTSDRLL